MNCIQHFLLCLTDWITIKQFNRNLQAIFSLNKSIDNLQNASNYTGTSNYYNNGVMNNNENNYDKLANINDLFYNHYHATKHYYAKMCVHTDKTSSWQKREWDMGISPNELVARKTYSYIYLLSNKLLFTQRIPSLSCHYINRSFLQLSFHSFKQTIQRLTCVFLQRKVPNSSIWIRKGILFSPFITYHHISM